MDEKNKEKIDAIFFIGPQGSGKGTQAKLLASRLGFFYWEMGGIIREVAQQDSELGQKTKEMNNAGILFPDDFLVTIVQSRLAAIPKDTGVIFDGIPRRTGQAHFLIEALRQQGRQRFLTILLDLPKEESLQRLLKRAGIEHRADDAKEKIEFRLGQYYHDTVPMLEVMRAETTFVTIDGRPDIEEVTGAINKALGLE